MSNSNKDLNNKSYNVSYKKILLIFVVTFVIILTLAILFYININKDTSRVIKGHVKYVGDDYIILSDNDSDTDYLIDVDDLDSEDCCDTGDVLSLIIDKIKNDKDPIEAEAKNVKVISKAKKEEVVVEEKSNKDNTDDNSNVDTVTDNVISNNKTNNNNNVVSNNSGLNNNSSNTQNNTIGTDEDVISYFNGVNNEVDSSKSLTESVKNGFVSVVDFLFYGKAIKGKTFDGLSTSAKLKVLKLGIVIDKKIDSKFPGYKSTLSSKYQNVKSQAISKYLDKTADVCSHNEDTCESAREDLKDLKNNFSVTWSFIKDISGVGISKLKAWYEVWRQS